jgi:ABC-type nitrate/sulfonate/bicarbonate transport system substrate-binding protein
LAGTDPYVVPPTPGGGLVVGNNSEIHTVADLVGKKIDVSVFSGGFEILTQEWVASRRGTDDRA